MFKPDLDFYLLFFVVAIFRPLPKNPRQSGSSAVFISFRKCFSGSPVDTWDPVSAPIPTVHLFTYSHSTGSPGVAPTRICWWPIYYRLRLGRGIWRWQYWYNRQRHAGKARRGSANIERWSSSHIVSLVLFRFLGPQRGATDEKSREKAPLTWESFIQMYLAIVLAIMYWWESVEKREMALTDFLVGSALFCSYGQQQREARGLGFCDCNRNCCCK